MKGGGNSLDFGARIYNSRLCSWLSLSPDIKKYPSLSLFISSTDNPILLIVSDG
ncbi:MAG: hypothetical protein V1779_09245 [bacterium]